MAWGVLGAQVRSGRQWRGLEPGGLRKINPAVFSRRDGVGSVPAKHPGNRS